MLPNVDIHKIPLFFFKFYTLTNRARPKFDFRLSTEHYKLL